MAATKSAAVGIRIGTGRRPGIVERTAAGLLARTAAISLEERERIAWTEAARIENRRFDSRSVGSALVSDRIVRPS